jgi:uridine kinase
MIIGVCGGSCSGKTTFSHNLKGMLDELCTIVSLDNYYIAHNDLTLEERKKINYDEPNSIDYKRVIEDLKLLKNGTPIVQPSFSYNTFLSSKSGDYTPATKVVIVEGIFVFSYPKLYEQLDLKIFIDAEADIRFSRKMIRDTTVHHRTLEFIINQYLTYTKPMHELYVEPQKQKADFIISSSSSCDRIVEILANLIQKW